MRFIALLSIPLLLCSLTNPALGSPTDHFHWLPKIFGGPDFSVSFDDIESIAKESHSTLEFTEKVIQEYPQFQTNFTLVYKSQSLQSADFKHPRIIFFAPNGMFFTVGTKASSNTIEVMSFNEATSAFDFREITYIAQKASTHSSPTACAACHAGKPIWEGYPRWPGVYGSADDYAFEGRQTPTSLAERAKLKTFIETQTNPYLQAIGLDADDYFLDSYASREEVFSPKRRNNNLLEHIGYYHNLSSFQLGSKRARATSTSFLDPSPVGIFGTLNSKSFAARTLIYGFAPNDIYQYGESDGNIYSRDLRIKPAHKNEFDETFDTMSNHATRKIMSPIAKCLQCHGTTPQGGVPSIPFNDIEAIGKLFQTTDLKQKILLRISRESIGTPAQMPPSDKLSTSEHKALLAYLEAVGVPH